MDETHKEAFDFKAFEAQALAGLAAGQRLEGKDGVLAPMIKRLLEAGLQGELAAHLAEGADAPNRRNGKGTKQVKTAFGTVAVETPP